MDIEIKKEKDMPLLSRQRVTSKVSFQGPTPSREDIRKALAKVIKKEDNLVFIRHIYTKFGSANAKVIAHVYDSVGKMKDIESEKDFNKNFPPPKKEEPKAEAPKEEAKVEEKKEAPKKGE